MKQLSLLFFCIIVCSFGLAQPKANSLLPAVDKRIELLSIVFRLAKAKDFNDTLNPIYAKAIDSHFSRYSGHPLINYIRQVRDSLQKDSIEFGYWEIASIAVHLTQPPKLDPVVSLDDPTPPDGWDNRAFLKTKLVTLLKEFYHDAACDAFFESKAKYYKSVDQRYEKVGTKLNRKWIEDFFGLETTENYYAIIGLCMREGAYLRVNFQGNNRHTFTIFGCTSFDDHGLPTAFPDPLFPRSMLHEYIHAFTNQLIDRNMAELQEPAETILANPKVFRIVENTFYGNWQFLLYESLVRASAIRYTMDNKEIKSTTESEITSQERAGFLWMRGLVDELGVYKNNRKTYKNLEAFMPELIKYFKNVAAEMKP